MSVTFDIDKPISLPVRRRRFVHDISLPRLAQTRLYDPARKPRGAARIKRKLAQLADDLGGRAQHGKLLLFQPETRQQRTRPAAHVRAAVEDPGDNELGTQPFVVWVRGQLRECVHATLGFEVSDDCWEESVPDAVRERLSQFSTCRNITQVRLGVCELVSQLSECVLNSAKKRTS